MGAVVRVEVDGTDRSVRSDVSDPTINTDAQLEAMKDPGGGFSQALSDPPGTPPPDTPLPGITNRWTPRGSRHPVLTPWHLPVGRCRAHPAVQPAVPALWHAPQIPVTSTVWLTSEKPCSAATVAAQCSTSGPSISTVRPHRRQTRW